MNNRFDARARQNRATAFMLTLLFHIALIGGIYYYHLNHDEEQATEVTDQPASEAPAKPVSTAQP